MKQLSEVCLFEVLRLLSMQLNIKSVHAIYLSNYEEIQTLTHPHICRQVDVSMLLKISWLETECVFGKLPSSRTEKELELAETHKQLLCTSEAYV